MSEFISLLIKSNTLNFLIVAVLIFFCVSKLNIGTKIRNIEDKIKNYVASSENDKIEAQNKLDVINAKIKKLPEVTDRIKRITENSVKNYEKKIQNDIIQQKADISNNVQRLFKLETKKFKNKLINLLSDKSVEIARQNAIEQLKNNNELHKHYIDNAIEELDRIKL